MELKVVCQCGQKFKFDVEPVNGQMPFTVNCPVCNLDGTSTANAMLTEFLASQPPPLITAVPPPPAPIAPSPGGLRIHHSAPPPPQPEAAVATQRATAPGRITIPKPSPTSKRKLEWYEHIWCALPLCLVAIGGAIGGGCGGVAWAFNRQVFQKLTNPVFRYLVTGLISAAAFGSYLALAILLFGIFHKQR